MIIQIDKNIIKSLDAISPENENLKICSHRKLARYLPTSTLSSIGKNSILITRSFLYSNFYEEGGDPKSSLETSFKGSWKSLKFYLEIIYPTISNSLYLKILENSSSTYFDRVDKSGNKELVYTDYISDVDIYKVLKNSKEFNLI